jgi:hypothetical protein
LVLRGGGAFSGKFRERKKKITKRDWTDILKSIFSRGILNEKSSPKILNEGPPDTPQIYLF